MGAGDLLPAGHHRLRAEIAAGAAPVLQWRPPGGTFAAVPAGWLNPRYGLATTTTAHDPPPAVTAVAYDRPETGLATTVTVDPAGLALVTATAYEEPGAGRFFRRTSRTLPAGNATTDAHYGPSEARAWRGSNEEALAQDVCLLIQESVEQGARDHLLGFYRSRRDDPIGREVGTDVISAQPVASDARRRVRQRAAAHVKGEPRRAEVRDVLWCCVPPRRTPGSRGGTGPDRSLPSRGGANVEHLHTDPA